MISQFYVLSPRGDTIISRDYRGDVPKGTAAIFFRKVKFFNNQQQQDAPPIFHLDGINYLYIKQNGLYFVATTRRNASGSFLLELLMRISRVLKDYCGVMSEESIRKNFVLIYELMDEILDFGYPQGTSSELLKAYVFNQPVVLGEPVSRAAGVLKNLKMPDLNPKTTPSTSVDKPITGSNDGGKRRNEIFVDIYERINVTLTSNGEMMNSEIDGTIQMKSYLAGNPGLRLALNEELVIAHESTNPRGQYGAIVLDDCNFHECVRTDEFDGSRTLCFVPPDGEFGVMNYRITGEFRAPFRIFPLFEMQSPYKVELVVKIRGDIPETNYAGHVEVQIPMPKTTSGVSCDLGMGTTGQSTEFSTKERRLYWRIKKFSGGTEQSLRARILLSSSHTESVRKEIGPVSMKFEIPMYNVSGLQVRYLRIAEQHKSYNPYRWVRYVTKSGSYVSRV